MRRLHERGAVLVETALIISTALTLMLFTVDVGILGFLQVSADAASFFDAHENVVGVSTVDAGLGVTPESYTHGLFPVIKQSDMSSQIIPAPTPSVEVNYGYNAAVPNANSGSQRHGGVSMFQPIQYQVTVSPSPFFNIAGQQVGVQGQDIEPKWTECGPHYNVANENYACGDASAPPNSAASLANAENTPPYYVGYNLMMHCTNSQPWGDPNNNGTACTSTNFLALGTSAYLDTNNWNAPNAGISGDPLTYGSLPTTTLQDGLTSTFQAAAFHQRVYSNIAKFLATYPTLFPLYNDYTNAIYAQLGITHFGGTPTASYAYNNNWAGFANSNTSNPLKLDPNGIDEAIQCVYNWDETIASGFAPTSYTQPGQVPLYPEKPCAQNVTL